MQSMKETAANAGPSAMAGLEKAKASVQEKVDKMKTRNPIEKEMVRERKEERKELAERMKQEARDQTATARQAGGGYTTGGGYKRGDASGYTATGTGNDVGRNVGNVDNVGYDGNVGYAGDTTGGYAYSTTGSQDYQSGEYEGRNWEEREPNNAAATTRRNTRLARDDPCGP